MARKLKLIVNALPLTTVNTGIGRHLRCLYEQLEKDHGQDLDIAYWRVTAEGMQTLGEKWDYDPNLTPHSFSDSPP